MIVYFLYAILIFFQFLWIQEVQASSLVAAHGRIHQVFANESNGQKNYVLQYGIRSESTDDILPFELLNSGKSDEERSNLTDKLYVKIVSEIIEKYERNRHDNARRYITSAEDIRNGNPKGTVNFSHWAIPSLTQKFVEGALMNGIKIKESCNVATRGCPVKLSLITFEGPIPSKFSEIKKIYFRRLRRQKFNVDQKLRNSGYDCDIHS